MSAARPRSRSARRLARLARTSQVLVVTHLPQVAAFADRHLVVAKSSDGVGDDVGADVLDDEGRVRELSRMLAGLEDSETAIAHAQELLATAQQARAAPGDLIGVVPGNAERSGIRSAGTARATMRSRCTPPHPRPEPPPDPARREVADEVRRAPRLRQRGPRHGHRAHAPRLPYAPRARRPGRIVVLDRRDLDATSARALVARKPLAVLNAPPSSSPGRSRQPRPRGARRRRDHAAGGRPARPRAQGRRLLRPRRQPPCTTAPGRARARRVSGEEIRDRMERARGGMASPAGHLRPTRRASSCAARRACCSTAPALPTAPNRARRPDRRGRRSPTHCRRRPPAVALPARATAGARRCRGRRRPAGARTSRPACSWWAATRRRATGSLPGAREVVLHAAGGRCGAGRQARRIRPTPVTTEPSPARMWRSCSRDAGGARLVVPVGDPATLEELHRPRARRPGRARVLTRMRLGSTVVEAIGRPAALHRARPGLAPPPAPARRSRRARLHGRRHPDRQRVVAPPVDWLRAPEEGGREALAAACRGRGAPARRARRGPGRRSVAAQQRRTRQGAGRPARRRGPPPAPGRGAAVLRRVRRRLRDRHGAVAGPGHAGGPVGRAGHPRRGRPDTVTKLRALVEAARVRSRPR